MAEKVNSLWVGSKLSSLELLTIHSYLDKGCEFHLWAYDPIETLLPAGTHLRDANEIILHDKIFYKKANDPSAGVGKGSLGTFSDIFRYKLLYENGGWWTDMDMTCLQPLPSDAPYYFRSHDKLKMIGNVMKCPPQSELMRITYEETNATCNADTEDWLLTNKILNQNIEKLQLESFIHADESNHDIWEETYRFISRNTVIPASYRFLHWMNEEWRQRGLNKNEVVSTSTLGKLYQRYGLPVYSPLSVQAFKNYGQRLQKLKFSKWRLLQLILATFIIAYTAWEVYWYRKVDLSCIKWHTHLMVYVYLFTMVYAVWKFLWIRNGKISQRTLNIFLSVSSVLAMLGLVEAFFCISPFLKTRQERFEGHYYSPYRPSDKTHHHVWPPHFEMPLESEEFKFPMRANSLGYADYEWVIQKKDSSVRVLCLGDSFTEGDGADMDSSYVATLRRMLVANHPSIDVLNAGSCGSDPFFNYKDYVDRLKAFKPDILIQTISIDDVLNDLSIRGGLERFKPNGKLQYHPGPPLEPLYAISYVSRLGFRALHYNVILKPEAKYDKETSEQALSELFRGYNSTIKAEGAQLFIVLLPLKEETHIQHYTFDLKGLIESSIPAGSGIRIIDLLPYYERTIAQSGKPVSDFYWMKDGHHNARGYAMMASGIFEGIKESIHRDSTAFD